MTWEIHPSGTLGAHAARWDELLRQAGQVPFLESAFLVPLLEVFGTGRERLALHVGRDGLDAGAIVQPAGRGMWETFQPSQLPLGPFICKEPNQGVTLMRSLLRALPGLPLGLGATQLDPRHHARPGCADDIATLDYVSTSFLEVSGSFDDYWDRRGKNLRQNLRKQLNKLQAGGQMPRLECVTSESDVAAAIEEYGRLESTGWKAQSGTAVHADNDQGRFYRMALERFAAMGRARVYRYRLGDAVVAMDLCIDNGPLVVVLKTAYDETYRQVSPSTLMRHEQFRQWWAEGRFRRVEFYGKTLEWHTRWTDDACILYHLTAYRWPWIGRMLARRGAQRAALPDVEPATPAD